MEGYKLLCLVLISSVCIPGLNCQLLSNLIGQDFMRDFVTDNSVSSDVCVHDVPTQLHFDETNEFARCFERSARSRGSRHPDQDLRANQIITKYGYNLETFDNVTTEDGYILTVFRISVGPSSPSKLGKPAVLLYHGMGVASDIWLLQNDVNKNLAIMLANDGFDVWLINSRGTDFSQQHVKWNSRRDIQYWDFSYHEFGKYDFPAVTDFILKQTGKDKIFLVCHSMGCAVYGIALSELPSLKDKIAASVLLAPAFFIGHTYSPLRALSAVLEMGPNVQRWINLMLRGRLESGTPLLNFIQSRLCTPTALRCGLCELSMFYIYGYDAFQLNYTNIPNMASKLSNTQSVKTLLHLGQNFRSCLFREYDYGKAENLRRYKQAEPPSYKLDNLLVPNYIYYSDADNFVHPVDIMAAKNALPPESVKGFTKVQWKYFNHIDFMVAEDADVLVYNDVIETLNKYVMLN